MDINSGFNKLILDEIAVKFSNVKTKKDVIKALENNSVLNHIPLTEPKVTIEQAHKDFKRERVLLNDLPFIPDNTDLNRCHAFAATLTILVERMMRNNDIFSEIYETSEDITDLILQRACRTSAGADSFFKIQQLLCVEDTFVTQKTFIHDPPIRVDVFVGDCPTRPDSYRDSTSSVSGSSETSSNATANESTNTSKNGSKYLNSLLSFSGNSTKTNKNSLMNAVNIQRSAINNLSYYHSIPANCNTDGLRFDAICCRITVQNSFAIYDTEAIDQITGNAKEDPTPWLEVEAVVIDESNFKTNEYDRSLQLLVTCPSTGTVYQSMSRCGSNGDYTPSKRSSGRLSDRLSGKFVLGDVFANWVGNVPRTPSPLPTVNNNNYGGTPERNTTHKHHSRNRSMSAAEQVNTYSSPNTATYSIYGKEGCAMKGSDIDEGGSSSMDDIRPQNNSYYMSKSQK